MQEWSIQQIARIAGTTSRTLRHYDDIGLLPPSRIGSNGYRYYDEQSLVRLQRILLLRELGLGLSQIEDVLTHQQDEQAALTTHLTLLKDEQQRLARQVAAVEHTIEVLAGRTQLMADEMFDGFDHTEHKDEVEQRWGKDAYQQSDNWWKDMSDDERRSWMKDVQQLQTDWVAAAKSGEATDSPVAQGLAERHVAWLSSIPGTPSAQSQDNVKPYVRALAQMYVEDERFAANYGGTQEATFVRDALLHYLAD